MSNACLRFARQCWRVMLLVAGPLDVSVCYTTSAASPSGSGCSMPMHVLACQQPVSSWRTTPCVRLRTPAKVNVLVCASYACHASYLCAHGCAINWVTPKMWASDESPAGAESRRSRILYYSSCVRAVHVSTVFWASLFWVNVVLGL